jgi:hypothetical protein
LTWKIGAWTISATSDGYGDDREYIGLVVKPIWLFTMKVDRAAGAVALQAGQRETFGHNPLPRKGRVAMQQQRQDDRTVQRAGFAVRISCLERDLPSTTGSTASR